MVSCGATVPPSVDASGPNGPWVVTVTVVRRSPDRPRPEDLSTGLISVLQNIYETVEYLRETLGDDSAKLPLNITEVACHWVAKAHPRNFIFKVNPRTSHRNRVSQLHSWAYGLAAFMGEEEFFNHLDKKIALAKMTPCEYGHIIGAAAHSKNLQILRNATERFKSVTGSHRFLPGVPFAAAIAAGHGPNNAYLYYKIIRLSLDTDSLNRDHILSALARTNDVAQIRIFLRRWKSQGVCQKETIAAASAAGSTEAINELLDNHVSKDCSVYHCDKVILNAVRSNKPDTVLALLNSRTTDPANPYIQTRAATNHAEIACCNGADKVFQHLVEFGLPLGHRQDACVDYLRYAVEKKWLHIVKLLRRHKYDFNHEVRPNSGDCGPPDPFNISRGAMALLQACRDGETSIVKMLLDWGGPVDTQLFSLKGYRCSFSFVEAAMIHGHEKTIRLLLDEGRPVPWLPRIRPFVAKDEEKYEEEIPERDQIEKHFIFPAYPSSQDVTVERVNDGFALRYAGVGPNGSSIKFRRTKVTGKREPEWRWLQCQ